MSKWQLTHDQHSTGTVYFVGTRCDPRSRKFYTQETALIYLKQKLENEIADAADCMKHAACHAQAAYRKLAENVRNPNIDARDVEALHWHSSKLADIAREYELADAMQNPLTLDDLSAFMTPELLAELKRNERLQWA
jgi:hypothetical protein